MTKGELLNLLTKEAKKYRKKAFRSIQRNVHMNDLSPEDIEYLKKNRKLTRKTIDALLVDFINYVGVSQCVDFGLYTKYLK